MSSFPTGMLTEAHLAEVIAEIWPDKVNDIFYSNLKAASFFTDMSEEVVAGGDIINIPNLQELSTSARGTETAMIPLQGYDMDSTTLTIATEKVAAVGISRREMLQMLTKYSMQTRLMEGLNYAIRKDLDTALLGLYSGIAGGYTVNDSASAVEDADILQAIGLLAAQDIPLEECAFFFYPTIVWGDLMVISKYYDASSLGINPGPVASRPTNNSPVGYLYGIPVYSSSNVPITATDFVHNMLAYKDAFAWAQQGGIATKSTYEHLYGANVISQSLLYGVIENRAGAAIEIDSIS